VIEPAEASPAFQHLVFSSRFVKTWLLLYTLVLVHSPCSKLSLRRTTLRPTLSPRKPPPSRAVKFIMGKSKVKEVKVYRRSQGVSPTAVAEQVPPPLPPSPSPEMQVEPMTTRSKGATEYVPTLAIQRTARIDVCATVWYRYRPVTIQ
jgi:hypothetical protein